MKYYLLFSVLVFQLGLASGQNLIPNPSFEDVPSPTTRWSGTHFAFHRNINGWTSPTGGSPDVLYVEYLGQMFPQRPKVDLTPYLPRTGDYMIGIKTYGCATNTLHCKEYLQVRLDQPIQEGVEYYFEYWVCPIATSAKVNGFGVGLSRFLQEDIMQPGLIDIRPVAIDPQLINGDGSSWHLISGSFLADDNYSYIVFGNFADDDTIQYQFEAGGIEYGYYLIDDVLVKPLYPVAISAFIPNEVIVLENILFEFDQAIIQERAYEQLDALVDYLQTNPTYGLEIMGHTDSDGTDAYNLQLSQLRADAIKKYLMDEGIVADRIQSTGMGRNFPLVANDGEENRQINRRVEVKVLEQ